MRSGNSILWRRFEVRTPLWWRVVEVVSGVLVIILAGLLISDAQLVASTVVLIIGVALLVVGLSRIGVGVFARLLPSRFRALNAGGGIVATVLAVEILLDLHAALDALTFIIALGLLTVGALEIVIGGFARHPPVWLRAGILVVGVSTILLSGAVIFDPALGQVTLTFIISVGLVIVGLRNIVHGISGHHPVRAAAGLGVTQL